MTFTNRRSVLKMIAAAAGTGVARVAGAESGHDGYDLHHRSKFVLIHGAWHNGSAWDGVARALRGAGHEVETPSLPGSQPGEDQSGLEFHHYADAVVDVLQRQRHRVIVVAHSSAGMLLQAAAPQVRGAISMIVFCNAFIVGNGQSQFDNLPPDATAGLRALATQNNGIVPFAPLEGFIRGALMEGDSPARQDALLQVLVNHPVSLFDTPVDTGRFEALDIPKAWLFCRRDHSADYPGMATRLGHYEVMVADGSHEMLFSAPNRFTNALLALIDANGREG
jgi:alpha-beta hydrolase superfamily lysophospholipase